MGNTKVIILGIVILVVMQAAILGAAAGLDALKGDWGDRGGSSYDGYGRWPGTR